MNKKILKKIIVIVLILLILWIVTVCIDMYRCLNFKAPIFAFSRITYGMANTYYDDKTINYNCLGYEIHTTERNGEIYLARFYVFNEFKLKEVKKSNL